MLHARNIFRKILAPVSSFRAFIDTSAEQRCFTKTKTIRDMTRAYSNDRYDGSEKLAKKLARNGICPGADKIPCTVLPTLEIISVKQGTGGVWRFMRKIVIFTGTCHHINGVMRAVLRYLQLYKEPGDIYTQTHVHAHTSISSLCF